MMGIQGAMPPVGFGATGSQSLNDTEKQKLSDLLANYDTEDLSDEQAKEIVDGIKELDIAPGRGLAEALGTAGIDARALAEQAGLGAPGGRGGPGGPSGGGPKGPDSSAVETLRSVVEELLEATSDEEDSSTFSTLLSEALEAAGVDTSSPVLDYKA